MYGTTPPNTMASSHPKVTSCNRGDEEMIEDGFENCCERSTCYGVIVHCGNDEMYLSIMQKPLNPISHHTPSRVKICRP